MAAAKSARTAVTQVYWTSGIKVLAGVWLLMAPSVLGHSDVTTAPWNSIIVGLGVGILAIVRLATPLRSAAASWVNAILGVWLVIAPFALVYGDVDAAMVNHIVGSLVVLILAASSALAARR